MTENKYHGQTEEETQMANVIAKAKTGTYIGHQLDSGVVEFLGIPYVKPPQRWKKAEELPAAGTADTEAFVANTYGHPCWQTVFPEEWKETPDMSEDCLTLNIWTADVDTKGKPVMVWIHGGSFFTGAAHIDCCEGVYCGDQFVADQPNIVYVNFNYRLNAFGMFDLSSLDETGDYADSLNLATYDQMAALKWVRENIEAFGGDPANITVFGQSAGGGSVSNLCCIPQANALFDKAIIQSAGLSDSVIRHKEQAEPIGRAIIDKLGAKTMADMLAASPEQIRDAAEWYFFNAGGDNVGPFDATWGVGLLPDEPLEGVRQRAASHLTVMTGTTSGEYASWVAGMTTEEIRQMAMEAFPAGLPDELVEQFIQNDPDRSEREALIDLHMDVLLRGIQLTMAEALVKGGSKVYNYYISCVPEGAKYKPQHCFEIPYIAGKPLNYIYLDNESGEPCQGIHPIMELVPLLQGCWASFAKQGNPNGPHITKARQDESNVYWSPYTLEHHETLVIDYEREMTNGVREKDWAIVGPLHYSGNIELDNIQ